MASRSCRLAVVWRARATALARAARARAAAEVVDVDFAGVAAAGLVVLAGFEVLDGEDFGVVALAGAFPAAWAWSATGTSAAHTSATP